MIQDKKNNKDHRIALQKRLAKAKKRLGLDNDSLDNIQPTPKPTHSTKKPDPVRPLLHHATQTQQAREQERAAAQRAASEKRERDEKAARRREACKQVHKARTWRGQPKLSAQIGLLLEKLQK